MLGLSQILYQAHRPETSPSEAKTHLQNPVLSLLSVDLLWKVPIWSACSRIPAKTMRTSESQTFKFSQFWWIQRRLDQKQHRPTWKVQHLWVFGCANVCPGKIFGFAQNPGGIEQKKTSSSGSIVVTKADTEAKNNRGISGENHSQSSCRSLHLIRWGISCRVRRD